MWKPLGIEGAWEIVPKRHRDDRGWFMEAFKQDRFKEAVGHPFNLAQVNVSHSKAGVVRGVHFSAFPVSQAKYVTCLAGSVLDVIVDVRVGSETFGKWEAVVLDSQQPSAVYLSEGLGHAFMALTDDATVSYLVSSGYAPEREHGVNPLDPALAIDWPTLDASGRQIQPLLSPKDEEAPTLKEAEVAGLLPTLAQAKAHSLSLLS